VAARKLFHRAEQLRLTADLAEAAAVYEQPEAMPAWRDKVLLPNGHADFRNDAFIQEQTYELQLKYLELVNDQMKLRLTRLQPFVPMLPKVSADVFADWIVTKGPFDINASDGKPLISDSTRQVVQNRRGTSQAAKNAPSGPPQPVPTPTPK
jgi:hypothetical protein